MQKRMNQGQGIAAGMKLPMPTKDGDDTVIAAKIGEYVLPPAVVAKIGVENLDRMVAEMTGKAPGGKPVDGMPMMGHAAGGLIDERDRPDGTPATFERVQPPTPSFGAFDVGNSGQRSLVGQVIDRTVDKMRMGDAAPPQAIGTLQPAQRQGLVGASAAGDVPRSSAPAAPTPAAKPQAPTQAIAAPNPAMLGGSADRAAGDLSRPIAGGGLSGRVVSNTSAPDIKRIDGGSSPLFTNIDPATAADQIAAMRPGQVQIDSGVNLAASNAALARANEIRGGGAEAQDGPRGGAIMRTPDGAKPYQGQIDDILRNGANSRAQRATLNALISAQQGEMTTGQRAEEMRTNAGFRAGDQAIAQQRMGMERGNADRDFSLRSRAQEGVEQTQSIQRQGAQQDLAQKQAIGDLRRQLLNAPVEQRAGLIQRLNDLNGTQQQDEFAATTREVPVKPGDALAGTIKEPVLYNKRTGEFKQSAGGQAAPTPSAAHVEFLRQNKDNPGALAAFERNFGAGAAAQYLR